LIRGGRCRGRWFANLTQQLIIIALTRGEASPLSIHGSTRYNNVFHHNFSGWITIDLFQMENIAAFSDRLPHNLQIDYHTIFRLITTQSSD
jgi:hypothetical protein